MLSVILPATALPGPVAGLSSAIAGGAPAEGRAATASPAERSPQLPARIEQFAPPDEFLMVGPIKTHHLTRGGRGRPLVLVHGFGSSTYTWRRNLDDLAGHSRVFAVDLKGFGLTAKPKDGQYHVSAYADHLLGYLDAMKLEKPVLVGSSLGAAVAVRLALLSPGRVSGLILIDPAPLELTVGPRRDVRKLPAEKAAEPPSGGGLPRGLGPAMLRTLITRQSVGRWLKATYHDPSLVTEEMIETYFRPITIEGATEALASMMRSSLEPAKILPPLASMKIPTLVLWGQFDRIVPRAVAENYVNSIPESRLLVFDHSGHLPHEEEPERFHREVKTFVDRLP